MTWTSMPEDGVPEEAVLEELMLRLAADLTYESGQIMGSMISAAHPLAQKVFAAHLETNVGDPGLFPATAELEAEVISMLGELLGRPEAHGKLVSGGSEANVVALWAARNRARDEKGIERGRVICGANAHVSYDKAADLLGLELVKIPVTESHVMDVDAARTAVDDKTIALVALAGSTDLGAVDPIADLSDLAEERGLHLHVDAAFGGFVLPFLPEPVPPFDFQLPGVSSITVDPHKMGLSVQPAGGLLFRDAALAVPVQVDVPYLAGGATSHATITGTRTGAAVLATWALMRHLGRSGYREVVERCMDLTADLVAAVEQVEGVDVVMPPTMNIVGIRPTEGEVEGLSASLRSSGWAIGQFATHVRVVLLPHVESGHLERFVADLKAGVAVAAS